MIKAINIINKGVKSSDKQTKQQCLNLYKMYNDRYSVRGRDNCIKCDWNIEEYKKYMEENEIELVEIELEKNNGNKVRVVIPAIFFKNFTQADLNRLLKV